MAPVVLTGHWTWPGYNFVNDTAPNFLYAELLSRQGMSLPATIDSTTAVIQAAPSISATRWARMGCWPRCSR